MLGYALERPARIDAVDVNRYQTAMLELKLCATWTTTRSSPCSGAAASTTHISVYARLRWSLSRDAREVWDERVGYFDPKGPGLYFRGTTGWFARMFHLVSRARPGSNPASTPPAVRGAWLGPPLDVLPLRRDAAAGSRSGKAEARRGSRLHRMK